MRNGKPASGRSAISEGSPREIRLTSVAVPPTSMVMIFGKPAVAARCAAPMTPAAGPDSAVRTGKSRARAKRQQAAGALAYRRLDAERRIRRTVAKTFEIGVHDRQQRAIQHGG